MSKTNKIFSIITLCGCVFCYSQGFAQENTEAVDNTVKQEDTVEMSEQPQISTQSIPVYTWSDFLTNKDCRPLIKELANQAEYKTLYQNLKFYCNKTSAWDELLNTFRKEKKNVLTEQILHNNSSYIRYVKVVPYLLFDIQNLNATGTQPQAILDQMEQAIIDHQLDTVLSLMTSLPDTWQKGFKNTHVLTDKLSQIKEQLDNLNELKKEDNND